MVVDPAASPDRLGAEVPAALPADDSCHFVCIEEHLELRWRFFGRLPAGKRLDRLWVCLEVIGKRGPADAQDRPQCEFVALHDVVLHDLQRACHPVGVEHELHCSGIGLQKPGEALKTVLCALLDVSLGELGYNVLGDRCAYFRRGLLVGIERLGLVRALRDACADIEELRILLVSAIMVPVWTK